MWNFPSIKKLILPLFHCLFIVEVMNLSGSQFAHLQHGDNLNNTNHKGQYGVNEKMCMECLSLVWHRESTLQLSTVKSHFLMTQMVHLQPGGLGLCSSPPMNWFLGFYGPQFLHLALTHGALGMK